MKAYRKVGHAIACFAAYGFVLLLSVGCAASNSPKQVDAPAEWGPTYSLTDGKVEVRVAPQIGRVMHFSRVGEPNLLWTSPVSPPAKLGAFPNYGGDKLWPWPQDAWGWPPPKEISEGPYERVNDAMSGPVEPRSGLRGVRSVSLGDRGLESVYRLERASPATNAKLTGSTAAWSIVQVPPVDAVYVRLMKNRPAEPTTQMSKKPVTVEAINDRWIKLTPNYDGTKIGLAGDLLAVRQGERVLVIERTEGNDDPDLERQVAAQIYFHDGDDGKPLPSTYVELELIGPTKTLQIGQAAMLQTTWRILTPAEFDKLVNE